MRNGTDLHVRDLNVEFVADFVSRGAIDGLSPAHLMQTCDLVITCLPSPMASDAVVTAMLPYVGPGKVWLEMSTTDSNEVKRLGSLVVAVGGEAVDCHVSGGCSGFQYEIDLDVIKNDDLVLTGNGETVVIDIVSLPFLASAVIDYSEELIGARFVINNPNASSSCGCGVSFSM